MRLDGKDLSKANLRRTSLAGAKLSNVSFREAQLSGADLRGACLEGAKFQDATASAIRSYRADFSGADLATVEFLKCGYFKKAFIDEDTALPEDLCDAQ